MGRTSDARQRLVEAATHLIHTRGYNAVGVNELCAEAGVKKGSFYHFFPSKAALVGAMLDAHVAELRAWATERPEPTPLQRLVGFIDAARAGYLSAEPGTTRVLGCPIGNLAAEMSTQDEQIRLAVARCYGEVAALIGAMLEQAVEAGQLAPCDTAAKAMELITYMQGAALMAKALADPSVTARAADALPGLLGVSR